MSTSPNRSAVDGQGDVEVGGVAPVQGRHRAALSELLARDLSGLDTAVLMIDGLNVAGQMITVALVITR